MHRPPTLIAFAMMLILSSPAIGAETSIPGDWISGTLRAEIAPAGEVAGKYRKVVPIATSDLKIPSSW